MDNLSSRLRYGVENLFSISYVIRSHRSVLIRCISVSVSALPGTLFGLLHRGRAHLSGSTDSGRQVAEATDVVPSVQCNVFKRGRISRR